MMKDYENDRLRLDRDAENPLSMNSTNPLSSQLEEFERRESGMIRSSGSGSVCQPREVEERDPTKRFLEYLFITVTTAIYITFLSFYWSELADRWFLVVTYALIIFILFLSVDDITLTLRTYLYVTFLNTLLVGALFVLLAFTSDIYRQDDDVVKTPGFTGFRGGVLFSLILTMNVRIAKIYSHMTRFVADVKRMKHTVSDSIVLRLNPSSRMTSHFIQEKIVDRLNHYDSYSFLCFFFTGVSFFLYQAIYQIEGYIVSVMLLLSTEMMILSIRDISLRNEELDIIEHRFDFLVQRDDALFCGIRFPVFSFIRTVKFQPLSLFFGFIGAVVIIFFCVKRSSSLTSSA